MTLDLHWALNALFGLVLMGFGWFCRELWSAVQTLRKDLAEFETRVGTDYIRYDRLQDLLKPIERKLDQISSALMTKQDRD